VLALGQVVPTTERLGTDAEEDTAADYAIGLDAPVACESFVADAMCELLSAFLIVEDLCTTPQSIFRSEAVLDLASDNIRTALKCLNDCSVAFWRLLKLQVPGVIGLSQLCSSNKRRRGLPEGDCGCSEPSSRSLQVKPREQPRSGLVTWAPVRALNASIKSECCSTVQASLASLTEVESEQRLAAAILHLVDAHRAMEALSVSDLPSGAPESFESAYCCLCTALVTLDACWPDASSEHKSE
jgi:hypothetical protein